MAEPGSIDAWVEEELNAFFSTAGTQTKRTRAYVRVVIDGRDITDRLDPYLVSITVRNESSWSADIELDDRDGRLAIPPLDASVEIDLGWNSENSYQVFSGRVLDVEHAFGRRLGGRRMFIKAFGSDQTSNIKTPFQDHMGEGAEGGQTEGNQPIPFLSAFQQFMGKSNLQVELGSSLQEIMRGYWGMYNESALNWATRHGEEFGAWTQFQTNKVVMGRPHDFTPSSILARWGDNLISWRVHPYVGRPLWTGSEQQWFDHVKGQWQQTLKRFNLPTPWGGDWVSAIAKLPMPAPSQSVAQQQNDGMNARATSESGFGRILINGEPRAKMWSSVTVIGARPGVDGLYKVQSAVHTYSRQGFVTMLAVAPDVAGIAGNIGVEGYSLSGGKDLHEAAAP